MVQEREYYRSPIGSVHDQDVPSLPFDVERVDGRDRRLGSRRLLCGRRGSSSGCLGPAAVTHHPYEIQRRSLSSDQRRTDFVEHPSRLRYADSPVFLDLPNITSQFEANGLRQLSGRVRQPDHRTGKPGDGAVFPSGIHRRSAIIRAAETEVRQGVVDAVVGPICSSVVNAGANIDQFMLMTVNDINDVANAAALRPPMLPCSPSDNLVFRRGPAVAVRDWKSGA